jgi:hypothetical protein
VFRHRAFRSRAAPEAEILTLRHQLNVLRRTAPKRFAFNTFDRLVFSGLYRLAPSVLNALVIVKPQTVIAGIALDCVCSGDGSRELAAEGRML